MDLSPVSGGEVCVLPIHCENPSPCWKPDCWQGGLFLRTRQWLLHLLALVENGFVGLLVVSVLGVPPSVWLSTCGHLIDRDRDHPPRSSAFHLRHSVVAGPKLLLVRRLPTRWKGRVVVPRPLLRSAGPEISRDTALEDHRVEGTSVFQSSELTHFARPTSAAQEMSVCAPSRREV